MSSNGSNPRRDLVLALALVAPRASGPCVGRPRRRQTRREAGRPRPPGRDGPGARPLQGGRPRDPGRPLPQVPRRRARPRATSTSPPARPCSKTGRRRPGRRPRRLEGQPPLPDGRPPRKARACPTRRRSSPTTPSRSSPTGSTPAPPTTGRSSTASKPPTHAVVTEADRQFWSFRPLDSSRAPPASDHPWGRSPVDRFLKAKLDAKGLAPNPPADRRTLIRRASFDLTGLPPVARGGRGVRQRPVARRLREGRRPAPGQPGLRRALGPALARPRPVRREPRLRARLRPADRLPLPRLRHPRPERGHALRPLRQAPGRRRRDRARQPAGPDGHRLPRRGRPQHADHRQHRREGALRRDSTTWPPPSAPPCSA